ncbi:MAG: nucleoside kinase [Eubacteriales bacterium]
MVCVKVENQMKQYPIGTTYEQIVDEFQAAYDHMISLVVVDGKIKELHKTVKKDCEITFITQYDSIGHKAYERSAIMLFLKALSIIWGKDVVSQIKVEFAIGQGCYCAYEGSREIDEEAITEIEMKMRDLAEANISIMKKAYHIDDAVEIFRKQGMLDKINLFRYRHSSYVNLYEMDGLFDYFYGYMLPSTKYIKYFKVLPYEKGFMILLPKKDSPKHIGVFQPQEKLFQALYRANEWNQNRGINCVGDLNDYICQAKVSDLILVQEALQERRIAEIARDIVTRKGVKFVMIAGPSSSGKTTFSHRLSVQLETLGLHPHPIAVDDYFVNREFTPIDKDGKYNFECLEAVDTESLNGDMLRLLKGEKVEIPSFNFKTGQREYKGNYKQLKENDVLVIEGIHGLNDKMSYALPIESKYKIYISALTSLNIDGHNRIPTTDGRLLRRMVRDARVRSVTAKQTISMWASVRRGEEENIFPYQESADVVFNSALLYELSILKIYAEPLLYGIKKGEPEYFEAKRLLKFLGYFLGVESEILPNNSIIREFVGGSCF